MGPQKTLHATVRGHLSFLLSLWQGRQPGRRFLRPLPPLPAELRSDSPEAEAHPSFPPVDPELGPASLLRSPPFPAPFSFLQAGPGRHADTRLGSLFFTVFPRERSVGGLF